MTVRVLLADDDALLRAGVAVVLGTAEGIEVVGEAADGLQAIALCRSLGPDVVVMDVRMPGIDGIEATRRIVAALAGRLRRPSADAEHDGPLTAPAVPV